MRAGARAAWCLLAACLAAAAATAPAPATVPTTATARIEARSADLVVVGVTHGDTMMIHVSRALDNAPLRDAAVAVTLRGHVYQALADVDGGYMVKAGALAVPGAAAMEFDVVVNGSEQKLVGTLQVASPAEPPGEDPGGSARQIAWWVLNFAVCGGFLLLLARRRKKAAPDPDG